MRTAATAFGAMILVIVTTSVGAQRRAHADEVRLPGTDIMLKADWQLLLYGGCRFAVPLAWQADADGEFSRAPDGTTMALQVLSASNWSAHKADVRHAYGRDSIIHDDSDRRLWIETRKASRVEHYMAVVAGEKVCVAMIDLHDTSLADRGDTLKRIADGIGLAPEGGVR